MLVRMLLLAMLVPAAAHAQQGSIATGEEVYAENCATCHGERLRSTGAAPDLKQLPADEKPRFDTMVRQGKGQMPAWEGVISDEDLESIWAYIRARAR
jgi:mono/diheme cytochrome c family protein